MTLTLMNWQGRIRQYADHCKRTISRNARPIAIGVGLFIAAAIAFRVARSAIGFWAIDDAGITYALAFELVDHHSLAANIEGTPIEGYSNPLLFFVAALMHLFGVFDPITTHIHLEMLVFASMVTLVWSMLRSVAGELAAVGGTLAFAAIELLTPATWVWYGSGLENVWVSAGLVLLLWICVRTARGVRLSPAWGNAAFLVAITRPEAPVYVVAFYGALVAFSRPEGMPFREHVRHVARALTVTVALYIAFLAWRRMAYGAWLPNTYYAKLHGEQNIWDHLRDYVVGGVFPYCRAALFASSVFALLLIQKFERFGASLLVFLGASLALPIAAGSDWMGEHRFATPFLAMSHVAYAALLAVALANLTQTHVRRWRPAHGLAVVGVLLVAGLLKYDRLAVRDDIPLNEVTIQKVAVMEGALRWEQQMRLGVPFPVVQIPDAGGTLLVGAMQMLDNGYLTDFQMARIGRHYVEGHRDMRVLNQYQHEERRPDLVAEHKQFALDRSYLMTRYLPPGGGVLWPRHDLVKGTIDGATLLHDDGRVRIYLSAETVRTAGPSGLVRCELIVAWTDTDLAGSIRGSVEHGDRDQAELVASQRSRSGVERFALLLGAPDHDGSFRVSLELVRDGQTTALGHPFAIEVTKHLKSAIADALAAPTPMQRAHRLAWLREQQTPRHGMTAFRALVDNLAHADHERRSDAGAHIMALRNNARLAARGHVSEEIRAAELTVMRQLFDACANRTVCLGRVVDRLRRLGYLETLSRVPHIADQLVAARASLDDLSEPERYQALVGITLAQPEDVSLQWQLLKLRRRLATQATVFPATE